MPVKSSLVRDISHAALAGDLLPVYGRQELVQQIVTLLDRPIRGSILLVGPRGVGKAAIVHATACFAARSAKTKEYHFLQLNTSVAAAPTVRIYEETQELLQYASDNPGLVLFINDIGPFLASADKTSRAMESLPQAIRQGAIRCIGTIDEDQDENARKAISVFFSNLDVVQVPPMAEDVTVHALEEARKALEAKHGVPIDEQALRAAVTLTQRYLPKLYLPGKAFDVLERACVRYQNKREAQARYPEYADEASMRFLGPAVASHDVKRVVSEMSSIDIDAAEASAWQHEMQQRLLRRVFGQNNAVAQMAAAMAQIRMRFGAGGRTAGVLLLAGPTGSGKIHLTKCMARQLLGSTENMTVIDMAQYTDPPSMSTLFGTTAQFGGNALAGAMAPLVRQAALAIVVLDGIEQAHPCLFESLLPILQTGTLSDSEGRVVSFQRCLFVLTLNCSLPAQDAELALDGARALLANEIGFGQLLPTLDTIVPFQALGPTDAHTIVHSAMEAYVQQVGASRLRVRMHDAAYDLVVKNGFTPKEGAARLPTTLYSLVLDPLNKIVIAKEPGETAIVDILVEDGRIMLRSNVSEGSPDAKRR